MLARAALVAFSVLLIASCATGNNAIEKMSVAQRDFLETKLLSIKPNMSETEVTQILGPVYRDSGTNRPVWLGPEKKQSSQILIYYYNGRIAKIRWMEMGKFMWEKNLSIE